MCFAIILSRTNLWDGRYDSGDQKRQKNICCREVYFSDSSNYNVYGSDCVCELYCILHNLRLKGSQMPIYALEEFQYSPYNLTLLQAYFAIQGLKCMALIVVSTLMCLISNMTKNTMMLFIIFIGVTVFGLYCSGYICSDNVQKVVIAIASPFSLFKGFNIFKSLYELDLFGNFELRINVCIVIQVIFEMLLICISYYKYKHSNSRKESFR